MAGEIALSGTNSAAPFSLKVHRGDGMCLLGMDWSDGQPPRDFVGFTIDYRPPGHVKFLALRNRLTFATPPKNVGTNPFSTLFAPIQKFRWVHFPFDPELPGEYRYRLLLVHAGQRARQQRSRRVDARLDLARRVVDVLAEVEGLHLAELAGQGDGLLGVLEKMKVASTDAAGQGPDQDLVLGRNGVGHLVHHQIVHSAHHGCSHTNVLSSG